MTDIPQEAVKPVHNHFTPEALTQRVCPVCGVILPTVNPTK